MAKTTSTSNKDLCRLVTPEFRVSYPHVFKPQAAKQGDRLKYSITMLFPKNSDLTKLKEAIKQAKIAEFGPKENWPKDLESPVSDGDDPKNADKEGYKGHWIVKASSNEDQRPGVVDAQVQPILDQSKFYPGCYAQAYVYAYAWFYPDRLKPMKRGIGFILDHVQKLRDGKSFASKKSAEDVFAPVASAEVSPDADDGDDDTDFK